ncbi:hypothetical protein Tco_0304589 [Tanacetum coccineum]
MFILRFVVFEEEEKIRNLSRDLPMYQIEDRGTFVQANYGCLSREKIWKKAFNLIASCGTSCRLKVECDLDKQRYRDGMSLLNHEIDWKLLAVSDLSNSTLVDTTYLSLDVIGRFLHSSSKLGFDYLLGTSTITSLRIVEDSTIKFDEERVRMH